MRTTRARATRCSASCRTAPTAEDNVADGKDGENERPFELFMIGNGTGNAPAEFDDPSTLALSRCNLTIADQPTNTTVTWNGKRQS